MASVAKGVRTGLVIFQGPEEEDEAYMGVQKHAGRKLRAERGPAMVAGARECATGKTKAEVVQGMAADTLQQHLQKNAAAQAPGTKRHDAPAG